MEIFDAIATQMTAVRLPLYAVSASAAHNVHSPLYLFLHWHGFQRATPLQLPGVPIPARPVLSSLLKVAGPWYSELLRDELVLELAWRLGAWDVTRTRARGCNQIGAAAADQRVRGHVRLLFAALSGIEFYTAGFSAAS